MKRFLFSDFMLRIPKVAVWYSPNQPARATLPNAQDSQRAGAVADRAKRPSSFVDASGVQTDESQRRNRQDGKDGGVVGAGISGSSAKLARRSAGDVHDQPAGAATESASLPVNNQPHQEPAIGCAETNWKRCRWREADMMIRWVAGA
jgi:hypothetical protein